MSFCMDCGTSAPAGARFCGPCGRPLARLKQTASPETLLLPQSDPTEKSFGQAAPLLTGSEPTSRLTGATAAPVSQIQVLSCPYCLGAMDGKRQLCPACHVGHHEDCWAENGGCAVLGCAAAPDTASPTAATSPLVEQWSDPPAVAPVLPAHPDSGPMNNDPFGAIAQVIPDQVEQDPGSGSAMYQAGYAAGFADGAASVSPGRRPTDISLGG